MPKTLDACVRSVVDSYEDIDTLSCSSFVVFSKADDYGFTYLKKACHSELPFRDHGKFDILITAYPVRSKSMGGELDLKFFDFLKNRLYKRWSEFIHLEKTEDNYHYIRVEPLSEIPANVLYNFCIASRVIVEHRMDLRKWDKFCDLGLNPIAAFAFCRSDVTTLDQKVKVVMANKEHWPFYNDCDLAFLLYGPVTRSLDYKAWPRACTPTNIIWGNNKSLKPLEGSTIREFCTQWQKDHPNHEDILLAS